MARLIVKSPYRKGGGAGGYLKYIGTREGVEKLEQQPSGYMEYIAERPRSHGLFGDEDAVDMDAAIKEVNGYPGNIWTHIISLRREDAERLGYDHALQWRDLLRAHRNEIAQAMHIPPQDFRWYAAFHDEGEHPHVHMMAWSVKPGQAYLSKEGIRQIKSKLTNDIFKQEMLHTYEQKSASRDDLVREARWVMRELTGQMQSDICDSPKIEAAEAGNQYAQYALGKLHLAGEEVKQDTEAARYWFTQSAAQGNSYAQFFLDRWNSLQPPKVMLAVSRLLYHMSRVFQDAAPSPAIPGGVQIDRKRLRELQDKKIAMGHKLDDHEEQQQGWTMTMGW